MLKTQGILLKSLKYGESSLIVTFFTESHGVRQFICSGVNSKKGQSKAILLRPMNILELVGYNKSGKVINRLKEVKMDYVYQSIPFNVVKGTIGLFMTEVIQKSVLEEEPNLPLYHFLLEAFKELDKTEFSLANYPLFFIVKLTRFLGIWPSGMYLASKPYFDLKEGEFVKVPPPNINYLDQVESQYLSAILSCETWIEALELKIDRNVRQILLQGIIDYIRLHIDGVKAINSHQILREVLEN